MSIVLRSKKGNSPFELVGGIVQALYKGGWRYATVSQEGEWVSGPYVFLRGFSRIYRWAS